MERNAISTETQGANQALVRGGVGLLYGAVLALLSLLAAGGGHGTNTPLLVSSAPFGAIGLLPGLMVTPLLWGVIGSFAVPSGAAGRRMIVQAFLTLHYVAGLALAINSPDEVTYLGRVLRISPELFIIWSVVYLAGQISLWRILMRGN